MDTRWSGSHGIGRYATEVISRLTIPYTGWTNRVDTASPWDALSIARARLPHEALLYSPGFSTGVSRCRQLLTIHDLIHLGNSGRRGLMQRVFYDRVVKPIVRDAGHVLTVSHSSRARILEWIGANVEVHVTGGGVGSEFTSRGPRADLGRPYFLYVGNLKAHKNPRVIMRAASRFPDHYLVMVTSARLEAQNLAAQLGIQDRVRIQTGISDARLAALYRGAEGLLFPSIEEGFGLPPLEALRCGCPVLYYSGCEAVREVCSSEGGVDSADCPDVWADAMKTVSPPSRKQLEHIAQYTWDRVALSVDSAIRVVTGLE